MEIKVELYAKTLWYDVTFIDGPREKSYAVVENYDANSDYSDFEFVNEEEVDSKTREKILNAIAKYLNDN